MLGHPLTPIAPLSNTDCTPCAWPWGKLATGSLLTGLAA